MPWVTDFWWMKGAYRSWPHSKSHLHAFKKWFWARGNLFRIRKPSNKWGTENAYKEEIVNDELGFFQRSFQIIQQQNMCVFALKLTIFSLKVMWPILISTKFSLVVLIFRTLYICELIKFIHIKKGSLFVYFLDDQHFLLVL